MNRRRFIKYAGSTAVLVGAAAAIGTYALIGPDKVLPKINVTRIGQTTAVSSVLTVSEEGVALLLEESVAKAKPSSDIFVVNGISAENFGFGALMSLMERFGSPFYDLSMKNTGQSSEGLIHRDDVIIIKVNSQWDQRGGTNTDLLKEIIRAILAHPDGFNGEIIVADNGQTQFGAQGSGGSLDWKENNAEDHSLSVQRVVDSYSKSKVSTYLWDKITLTSVKEYSEGDMDDGYIVSQTIDPTTRIKVSYPKFKTKFGTYVSFKMGVWDQEKNSYNDEKLKVLNVPVLKTHSVYGITACVKHYMGVGSDKLGTGSHASVGRGGMGTQMAQTKRPILNILDAAWINANPRGGPRTTYAAATRTNILMASRDPVAVDYWAVKHVIMEAARAVGHNDLSSIDPDGENSSFGNWLRLSMQELQKAGHQATMNENQMNVYVHNLRKL
ncbi:MAG TPA: DUF362 domain-containing protein [Candidatus Bathyarchaeia archaeon]|nr:DUF362 domain-containing protein [Candidatus Bathyarchaeia archaeon]